MVLLLLIKLVYEIRGRRLAARQRLPVWAAVADFPRRRIDLTFQEDALIYANTYMSYVAEWQGGGLQDLLGWFESTRNYKR